MNFSRKKWILKVRYIIKYNNTCIIANCNLISRIYIYYISCTFLSQYTHNLTLRNTFFPMTASFISIYSSIFKASTKYSILFTIKCKTSHRPFTFSLYSLYFNRRCLFNLLEYYHIYIYNLIYLLKLIFLYH